MNRNSFRPGLINPRHYIFAIFMIALLALFLAPRAMAGCRNGKGKCDLPPPDTTTISHGTSTAVFHSGSNIHVEDGSFLECGSGTLSVDNGDYYCEGPLDPTLPKMHVTTDGFTGLFAKRFRAICGSLNSPPGPINHRFAVLIPDEVSYGWRDDCTGGTCRIEIAMEFSGPDVFAETDNKADQLSIVLGGWFNGESGTEANPFLEKDVTVTIDSANLEFRLTGKKRAVGLCPFGVAPPVSGYDVNHVTFYSIDP